MEVGNMEKMPKEITMCCIACVFVIALHVAMKATVETDNTETKISELNLSSWTVIFYTYEFASILATVILGVILGSIVTKGYANKQQNS